MDNSHDAFIASLRPGYWKGNIFHFVPAVRTPDGGRIHWIDLTGAELDEGITGEDVIDAILDPIDPAELRWIEAHYPPGSRVPAHRGLRTRISVSACR